MPKRSLAYTFYRSIWIGVDILFPPVCGGCEIIGSRWCVGCQQLVQILKGVLCEVCGLPQDKAGICNACLLDRPHFHALRAWAVFDKPLQTALHKLKYPRNVSIGDSLAVQMTDFVMGLNWPIDMIIPIPLGRQRMKERGYNQVGMIAKPLSMLLSINYAPKQLMRCRETRSQVVLTRQERRENVHQAFYAGTGVRGKNILVLDDVSTTGSTLSSSAEALFSSGAKDVYALTVARALPHHGLKHA